LERRLADLLEALAAKAAPQERARLQAFVDEARRHANELERSPIAMDAGGLAKGTVTDPVALAELLTDRYLEAGDAQRDEEALGRVQALAGHAIARLAWLRANLPVLQGV
jgi:hypothetical protein